MSDVVLVSCGLLPDTAVQIPACEDVRYLFES